MEDDSHSSDLYSEDSLQDEEDESSYVVSSEVEEPESCFSEEDVSSPASERRTKRRRLELPIHRDRPDTVQTRKLRPPQHLRQPKDPTPVDSSGSSESSLEPGRPCLPLST